MALAFYISHPQVDIDPDIPVPQWSLSEIGRARLRAVAEEPWVAGLKTIVSSAETKAVETAELLARAGGADIEIHAGTGEIDRSSTGYVPHARHEEIADALFAQPALSASGWERAVDAQSRITSAVDAILAARTGPGDIAFVGHGGVGTLLLCALKTAAIDRRHDQPGGGHVFAFEPQGRKLLFGWTPLEEVSQCLAGL